MRERERERERKRVASVCDIYRVFVRDRDRESVCNEDYVRAIGIGISNALVSQQQEEPVKDFSSAKKRHLKRERIFFSTCVTLLAKIPFFCFRAKIELFFVRNNL